MRLLAAGALALALLPSFHPDDPTPDCPRLAASGGSTDLYCIALFPAPGVSASGSAELSWTGGPFTVGVAEDGTHAWMVRFRVRGLPSLRAKGPRAGYVAWAASPMMNTVTRLGVVKEGETDLGPVALDRFLLLISAEPDTAVRSWKGPIVLRGESASNRLRPADNYQFFLGLTGPDAATAAAGHDHMAGMAGMAGMTGMDGGGWAPVPMFPGLDMLDAEMALRPKEEPYLPVGGGEVRFARPSQVVTLRSGDTLDLTADQVLRSIAGRTYLMLGFNEQYPGPLLRVQRGAEVYVRLVNRLAQPTTVHWHGIRLDNPFDGVPGATQPAVPPGGTFVYRLRFPDAGVFWYHPHVREDVQQDLGLYGNLFVNPPGARQGPAREEFLILDDLLIGDGGPVPYGRDAVTHAAMGRFGNVMLVNGEAGWSTTVEGGEVVRFYLTNVANTRTFNLSFGAGTRIKLIGSDQGNYARERWVPSVVIAPAERYVVDVEFPRAGRAALVNRVVAIDHLYGRFFNVTDTLGRIAIEGRAAPASGFPWLHLSDEAKTLDSLVAAHQGEAPEHTLELRVAFSGMPFVSEALMRLDSVYFNPVEWEGTMPGMNWATTAREARWILRDLATGAENMDIHWRFRRGTLAHLRLIGARNTLHGMQHPIHLHGQRFLVLAVNGVPNHNPVWKDTALVPAGASVDLLADMSNPGSWMLHCHIAEHLESSMMMHFDVEE
ncbi:MAG: multicopper oxidase family protein [Gemmatimonadales bacterium]